MIELNIDQIKVYNETTKLEYAFVMFQTLANECYRLQQDQMRFKRQLATNDKYKPKLHDNRGDKKRLKKLCDYEMKMFDKLVNQYVEKTNFMCKSFSDQLPEMEEKLTNAATNFMDSFLIIK